VAHKIFGIIFYDPNFFIFGIIFYSSQVVFIYLFILTQKSSPFYKMFVSHDTDRYFICSIIVLFFFNKLYIVCTLLIKKVL